MNALYWFFIGAWTIAIVWLVVDLAAERITKARRSRDRRVVDPIQQLDKLTETALRAMLLEALKGSGQRHRER